MTLSLSGDPFFPSHLLLWQMRAAVNPTKARPREVAAADSGLSPALLDVTERSSALSLALRVHCELPQALR